MVIIETRVFFSSAHRKIDGSRQKHIQFFNRILKARTKLVP